MTSEIHPPKSNKQPGFVDRTQPKECLSCRLIGTGALGGVGSYALWQSRATAPGSLGQKRVVAGLGVGQKFTWVLVHKLTMGYY
jgi:predicted ribosomally synthesized peptide with SipW-like signal peptide